MNLTLSIESELLERARTVAAGRGKSLNQMIRDLLEVETGRFDADSSVREIEALWEASAGRSGGVRFQREDTYSERLR